MNDSAKKLIHDVLATCEIPQSQAALCLMIASQTMSKQQFQAACMFAACKGKGVELQEVWDYLKTLAQQVTPTPAPPSEWLADDYRRFQEWLDGS